MFSSNLGQSPWKEKFLDNAKKGLPTAGEIKNWIEEVKNAGVPEEEIRAALREGVVYVEGVCGPG